MIVAVIFLNLICGSVLTSGSLYGVESFGGEEWWTNGYFLKFYSPSGKNYFINYETGEICKTNNDLDSNSYSLLNEEYMFQHLKVWIRYKKVQKMLPHHT